MALSLNGDHGMPRKSISLTIASLFLCAGLAAAQSSSSNQPQQPQQPDQPQQPRQPQPTRRGNLQPCWQVAGIDKSAVDRHAAIERETRSQIAGVCSNSSLTPQQKRQQVREIRLQAKQKMEGLVTPGQRQAFFACRQERGLKGDPGEPRVMGGCGQLPNGATHPSAPNGAPGEENPDAPANPASPQN